MCQTSSLSSQTKAGEFDLSEFCSFVPMNKTWLLLDVTRTYQVADSSSLSAMVTRWQSPCAGGDGGDKAPAVCYQRRLRVETSAEDALGV